MYIIELFDSRLYASEQGLAFETDKESISIGGSICYASKPNSYVIFPDRTVGKCTVGINDKVNKVGIISDEGEMELNENLVLWETAVGCYRDDCAKRPICDGRTCPLNLIVEKKLRCPWIGDSIKKELLILGANPRTAHFFQGE